MREEGWRQSGKHGEVGQGKIESDNNSNTSYITHNERKRNSRHKNSR